MASAAVDQGRSFLDSAKVQAGQYVDRRKSDAAQSVRDLAESLRTSSKTFQERPNIRAVFDSAADGLDQLADSVRSRSFAELYEDVEEAMRRRPATVAAASLAAGFLFSRFLKASAEEQRRGNRTRRTALPSAGNP